MNERKKKLLLIATSLKQGGFQRVCARTAVLLNQYFNVSVAIFDGRDIAYPLDNITIYNLGLEAKPGIVNKVWNVIRRVKEIKEIKKDQSIDISYSFGMSANLINVLSRAKDIIWTGIRSYVDLDTKSIGMVCKFSDVVICCSKELEKKIYNRYSVKHITTIYNPFDMDELICESLEEIQDKDFFEKDGKMIVAMGREDVLKGYWHLIKSFAAIKDTNTRLCIIGNGTFTNEKKLINELEINDRVYLTGGKRNPFAYLKYADIFVMSSLHEGFPNALVEAMSLGIPVISTNCETGPNEILSDRYERYLAIEDIVKAEYGILVPALSETPDYCNRELEKGEEKLTEAMTILLEDTQTREQYALASKKRATNFGTHQYIEKFKQLTI